jgi:hypothetical protein
MADNEDIEGETDWLVGINHQVVTVEVLTDEQIREWKNLRKDILSGFANSYKDLAENKTYEYKIRLTSDHVVFQFPYRKSLKERDEIKEEIEKM